LGAEALGDHELLAVVLGSGGVRGAGAHVLAETLLDRFGSLEQLAQASPEELEAVPGVGPVKAANIVATFALGRRCVSSSPPPASPSTGTTIPPLPTPRSGDTAPSPSQDRDLQATDLPDPTCALHRKAPHDVVAASADSPGSDAVTSGTPQPQGLSSRRGTPGPGAPVSAAAGQDAASHGDDEQSDLAILVCLVPGSRSAALFEEFADLAEATGLRLIGHLVLPARTWRSDRTDA